MGEAVDLTYSTATATPAATADSPLTVCFDGHPPVLVRASRLSELSLAELQEIVPDAWLARASRHRAEQWLISHPASGMPSAG